MLTKDEVTKVIGGVTFCRTTPGSPLPPEIFSSSPIPSVVALLKQEKKEAPKKHFSVKHKAHQTTSTEQAVHSFEEASESLVETRTAVPSSQNEEAPQEVQNNSTESEAVTSQPNLEEQSSPAVEESGEQVETKATDDETTVVQEQESVVENEAQESPVDATTQNADNEPNEQEVSQEKVGEDTSATEVEKIPEIDQAGFDEAPAPEAQEPSGTEETEVAQNQEAEVGPETTPEPEQTPTPEVEEQTHAEPESAVEPEAVEGAESS